MNSNQNHTTAIVLVTILTIGTLIVTGQLTNTLTGFVSAEDFASLLSPSDQGFDGQTRAENYAELMNQLYSSGKVTQVVDGKLWVPWYFSSTQCTEQYLHSGNSCNAGGEITHDRNCMVTDELSQVAILIAMGENQQRMDELVATLGEIESQFGQLPSWRVFRDGTNIEACKDGINGNCDTASDADARIIISLFTAANNDLFLNEQKKQEYFELAKTLTEDFVEFEVLESCKESSLGHGDICHWLAAGSQVRNGGMASTDFGYTGYYPDAIVAMLQACGQLENQTYCELAQQFTLNYLEAAKWDGETFSTPPGRSFKWSNLDGIPQAECTNTCGPTMWDGADAPRAIGICQAISYAEQVGTTLPGLQEYCQQWNNMHGADTGSFPIQYYPDGSAAGTQSSFFAQGLQALFYAGVEPNKFEASLDEALSHYAPSQGTWDWTACFGIYHQAIPMRALGHGIGRDLASFSAYQPPQAQEPAPPPQNISINSTTPPQPVQLSEGDTQLFQININNNDDQTLFYTWSLDGVEQEEQNAQFNLETNYTSNGTINVSVQVQASTNTQEYFWIVDIENTVRNASITSKSPQSPVQLTINESQNLTVEIENPDGHEVTFDWQGVGYDETSNQATFTRNQSGNYTVNVTLNAAEHTEQASWNIQVAQQAPQPPLQPISWLSHEPNTSQVINESTHIEFGYHTDNPDDQRLTIRWYLDGARMYFFDNKTNFDHIFTINSTVNLTVAAATNSLNHSWQIIMEQVEGAPENNQSSENGSEQPQEEEQNEQEVTRPSSSGGGGGGGGFTPRPVDPPQSQNNQAVAEEPNTNSPSNEVQEVIQNYFNNPQAQEDDQETITLVQMIRQLFGADS